MFRRVIVDYSKIYTLRDVSIILEIYVFVFQVK